MRSSAHVKGGMVVVPILVIISICAKLGMKQQCVIVLVTLAQEAQHAVSHVCHRHDLVRLKFEIYNDENRLVVLIVHY